MSNVNSIDLEKSVLGSIMKSNNLLNEVIDRISAGCFYDSFNRGVFDVIMELYREGRTYDNLSVATYMQKAGITCNFAELSDMVEIYHVSVLDDMRKRREIWKVTTTLAQYCSGMVRNLDEVTEEAICSIQDIMSGTADDGMVSLRKVYDQVRTTMDNNRQNPTIPVGSCSASLPSMSSADWAKAP